MKTIVVDIDGTLANLDHRLRLIEGTKKLWKDFYIECSYDVPYPEIVNLVNLLIKSNKYNIVFCTGRPEYVREKTIEWLTIHLDIDDYKCFKLLMRSLKDSREDTSVKPKLLENEGLTPDKVEFILDDRDSVVKKFRELGYKVLQVANGDY